MTRSIYIGSSSPGPVKIGTSGKPRRRLSALRVSSAVPLELAYSAQVHEGDADLIEARAHKILEAKQLRGEWFDVQAEAAVAAVIQATHELGFRLVIPLAALADDRKSRGRQRVDAVHVGVRIPPDQIEKIDAWIAKQPDPKPSRPEAMRRLIAAKLADE